MNRKLLGIHMVLVLILAFVFGCSGNSGNPVVPSDGDNPVLTQGTVDN